MGSGTSWSEQMCHTLVTLFRPPSTLHILLKAVEELESETVSWVKNCQYFLVHHDNDTYTNGIVSTLPVPLAAFVSSPWAPNMALAQAAHPWAPQHSPEWGKEG